MDSCELRKVEIDDKRVLVALDLMTSDPDALQSLGEQASTASEPPSGRLQVKISIGRVNIATEGVRGVRHVVPVGSGKRGVGKIQRGD